MLLDVDLNNTNQLAAEGAATLIGISVLTDSNSGPAMKVAAGALGFVAGNAGYNFLFGPGSVADSIEHPGAAVVQTLEGKGTLAQTAMTAGAGYASYQGGKALYGRVVQGGTSAAEEAEMGAATETVAAAETGAESAGLGAELLTIGETIGEALPFILI
jgi:hypothetical protein